MHQVYCPPTALAPNPTANELFEFLPALCEYYVNGEDGESGAASHLREHCLKVWDRFVENPADMLQQHQDGSFYTHVPIDTWEALNQHLKLATATHSTVLHILIADRLVDALVHVTQTITKYAIEVDTTSDAQLKEIELELFCAIVNDTAFHIEEVMGVVDNFEKEEIRAKIDAMFDTVTENLVRLGQACLGRLSGFVMNDLTEILGEVFTPEWIDGSQIKV